jgi:membrane-associated phospholipid phosphatase
MPARAFLRLRRLLVLGSLSGAPLASAGPLPTPVDAVGDDTARAFGGFNLIYFGAAVASTAVLVPSGGDHAVRLSLERHVHAPLWGDAAYYGGYVLPVVLPLGLWLTGVAAHDDRFAGAGSAAIQALVLTEVTVVLLKVGTGRPFPRHAGSDVPQSRFDRPEYSRDFVPFGFDGRYAWPSGHAAAAFSLAASLTAYAGDSVAIPAIAYPVAAGIGAGMIVGDHHWASDVVAGALIGQAIGWSVGRSFRERAHGASPVTSRFQLVPLVGGGVTGGAVWMEL